MNNPSKQRTYINLIKSEGQEESQQTSLKKTIGFLVYNFEIIEVDKSLSNLSAKP